MATENELLRVTLHHTMPGAGDCQNVFTFKVTGGDALDTSVLSVIDTWATSVWGTPWAAIAAGVASITTADVETINAAGVVQRNVGTAVINRAGGAGAEVMPAGVAGYVAGYTDVPKIRGKKYIPGIAESVVADGSFNTGAQASLASLASVLVTDIIIDAAVKLTAGVVSRKIEDFFAYTPVSAYNTLPAYQRRRKQGVGI